jgi:hypothetical protein
MFIRGLGGVRLKGFGACEALARGQTWRVGHPLSALPLLGATPLCGLPLLGARVGHEDVVDVGVMLCLRLLRLLGARERWQAVDLCRVIQV